MSEYFEIAYAVASKRLCLFTGTGFSKALTDSEAPSWQQLLEKVCESTNLSEAIKEALFTKTGTKGLSLDECAQVISVELTRQGVNIHKAIAKQIGELELSNNCLATKQFFKKESFRVVTTNYDKLAEEIAGAECQTLTPGRPVPRSNSRVKIFHVHGSVDVPERMIVTADDYFEFMRADSYFSRKLSTVLHENTVVILGYSLGDPNLKAILSDYRGFVRNHAVGGSIFFVSRCKVDQRVVDYYAHCYGIRVIDETGVEDFFKAIKRNSVQAKNSYEKNNAALENILSGSMTLNDDFLKLEQSFYQIVLAVGTSGGSLNDSKVVNLFAKIIDKKRNFCRVDGAWEQYEQLAAWLTYLGSLVDVRNTAVEKTYLSAVEYSMAHMSKELKLGLSWHAYKFWDGRWSSIISDNRALISEYIKTVPSTPDGLEIVNRI